MEKQEKPMSKEAFGTRTWEKLTRLVPGLAGYQGREKVREADKVLRVALGEALASHQGKIEELKRSLVEKKDLQFLPQLDLITRRMAQARDTLSYASYGYSGVFDGQKIGMAELEQMYQFDLSLAEEVEGIGQVIETLTSKSLEEGAHTEALGQLERTLQGFLDDLAKRPQILRR